MVICLTLLHLMKFFFLLFRLIEDVCWTRKRRFSIVYGCGACNNNISFDQIICFNHVVLLSTRLPSISSKNPASNEQLSSGRWNSCKSSLHVVQHQQLFSFFFIILEVPCVTFQIWGKFGTCNSKSTLSNSKTFC